MTRMTAVETTPAPMAVEHDPFIDSIDTPVNEHDCANDECEATRYADGIDIVDSRYL